MPRANMIPADEMPFILELWLRGKSSREIANRLVGHGVEVHHTSVWRAVQHLSDGHGSAELSAAVAKLRHRLDENLEEMENLEERMLMGARLDSPESTVTCVKERLPAINAAHRACCRRLALAGVNSKVGIDAFDSYAPVTRAMAEREAWLGVKWPLPHPEAGEALPPSGATPNLLHANEAKSLISGDSKCNSVLQLNSGAPPPPEAASIAEKTVSCSNDNKSCQAAPADASKPPVPDLNPVDEPKPIARNARCPCGSGLKFKRCHGMIPPGVQPNLPSHDQMS